MSHGEILSHLDKLTSPYTMTLKVKKEKDLYPGTEKTGEGEFVFTSEDFLEVMDAFKKNEIKRCEEEAGLFNVLVEHT